MTFYNQQESPKDEAAERYLIGACLIKGSIFPRIFSRLKEDDFNVIAHARIWTAMVSLFESDKPIDLTTVAMLSNRSDATYFLSNLMNEVSRTTDEFVDFMVNRIVNTSRRRKLIQVAGRIAAAGREEKVASTAEQVAMTLLNDAITADEHDDTLLTPQRQSEILKEYILTKKDANKSMIPTTFPSLDQMAGGGLHRGELIIIAARTSIGKSTYAENIAERVSVSGHRVLFVSVEMSPEQMMYRYAVRSGMLSKQATEFGELTESDEKSLDNLAQARIEMPFFLHNAPGATVAQVKAQVARVTMQHGPLGLVVVDYLQLMDDTGTTDKEHLRIGQITKSLKKLAREYSVSVILISQLNRNIEYRGGEPKLADLRESGRIEEDADLILMLWESDKPDAMENVTQLKIAKNRQGSTGQLPIRFYKPAFRFSEPIGVASGNSGATSPHQVV